MLNVAEPDEEPDHPSPAPRGTKITPRPLVVLKIGGSVLRSPEDAARVASEAYRFHRQGARVMAVVSAIAGQTDLLLAEAKSAGAADENRFTPHLVALGEARAAALAAMACERVGLCATVLSPEAMKLRADGPRESAELKSVDAQALLSALDHNDVVVVPGYVAVDAVGQPVLLGRGGTDFTALFLAAEIHADTVRLVKDVPGVFDRDPALHGAAARLYEQLSWADARAVSGKLIQPKALAFAHQRALPFEVAGVGATRATRVASLSAPPRPAPQKRRLRVGLAGCGVVGAGVARRLLAEQDSFELVGVLVRNPKKPRDVALAPALFTTDPDVLFAANPDVVVDALSSAEAGRGLYDRALRIGVGVVSANKQALADDLESLVARAVRSKIRFAYAAAVGGGCPTIETVRAACSQAEIARFDAVLNGTVNFILGQLADDLSFEDALKSARAAGFAEADPTNDLDGSDAAAKVRILAFEAFGVQLADAEVMRTPLDAAVLTKITRRGGAWKQISSCVRVGDAIKAEVRLVPASQVDPLFAATIRERNAIRVETADGRVCTVQGRGAGRWPTAEAVFADLLDMRADLLDA
jgi:homoserine dehydrogenase